MLLAVFRRRGQTPDHAPRPSSEERRRNRRITDHDFFFLSGDYRLIHRSKTQLLFSGGFGNVDAIFTFFYAADYGRDPNTIEVRSYLSNAPFETPVEEGTVIPAEASLTAISLVRVFRHTPEFLVISADYTPAGGLSAFHVNARYRIGPTHRGHWSRPLPQW